MHDDPALLINILREDTMANITDIITQELRTRTGREEFARKAREMRDHYSDTSASHWQVWNRIMLAAELLVQNGEPAR